MFKELLKYKSGKLSDFWGLQIPSSWNEIPGLAVLKENKIKNNDLAENQVLSLSYGRVVVKPVEKQRGLVPESYEGYQILEPGDIVIRPTDLQNDQTSIRVGQVQNRGIITSAYIGLRPSGSWIADYAYLYLAVIDSSKRIYGMGSGLRQQLGWNDIKRMPCLVPSADEQAAIVKYLAHANARIDNAIAAKQRLISLLEEQLIASRETFIWNKGLGDPLRRIGSLGTFIRGRGGSKEDDSTSGIACLRYGDIYTHFGLTANIALHRIPFEIRHLYQKVEGGDVVLTASGETLEDIGKATVVRFGEEAVAGGDTLIFRPGPEIDPEFLALVLATQRCITKKAISATGSTIKHISVSSIRSIPVPLPDIQMQKSIVAEYEAAEAAFCHGKEILKREIELLQEFRTRLVADVVTGQVDVRAVAATLPDAPTSVVTSPDATTEEAD